MTRLSQKLRKTRNYKLILDELMLDDGPEYIAHLIPDILIKKRSRKYTIRLEHLRNLLDLGLSLSIVYDVINDNIGKFYCTNYENYTNCIYNYNKELLGPPSSIRRTQYNMKHDSRY